MKAVQTALEKDWEPISFDMEEVYILSREGGNPFEVKHVVPLGGYRYARPHFGDRSPGSAGTIEETDQIGKTMVVCGLNKKQITSNQHLRDLFTAHASSIKTVELCINPDGKPRTCGAIEFKDAYAMRDCLSSFKGDGGVYVRPLHNMVYPDVIGSTCSTTAMLAKFSAILKPKSVPKNTANASTGAAFEKVVTSAIIVMPPELMWGQIQEIRKRHDKSFRRWMPHINLIYPFMKGSLFNIAEQQLADYFTNHPIQPFNVTFNAFDYFEHSPTNCTLFLNPTLERGSELIELQSSLEKVFPTCNEQSTKSDTGFHAHLTVGQFRGKRATETAKNKFAQNWSPISFMVDSVYLISRSGMEPFKVIKKIALNGQASAGLPNTQFVPAVQWPKPEPGVQVKKITVGTNVAADDTVGVALQSSAKKPEGVMGEVYVKLGMWMKKRNNPEHLPKNKDKLRRAIKPMCTVRTKAIEVDEVLKTFEEEGLIKLVSVPGKADQEVVYLNKAEENDESMRHVRGKEAGGYARNIHGGNANLRKEEAKKSALEKCRYWVRMPLNTPKGKISLTNCLEQLCVQKVNVEPDAAIKMMEEVGFISIEYETTKVNYHVSF
eukprot:TRINITY_DN5907_c0_g5_i1.p1 TRINITY_DN5907_c0_g5~~TRINITY_DN5907_c0_g5_i1.p1  ORF type:complete len:693 (+),score=99.51 TRINITY_DN5907_c0_g5_i1:262-2079(+)